jgi:hypothetical protein
MWGSGSGSAALADKAVRFMGDCRQGWRRTGALALVLPRVRERASCPLSIASRAMI